jgi:PA14 domain/Ricin-type beta-trefoil lectin domain-like/PKD domain/Secretion system C-terminal sorting domain/Bacterial Ig-like domain (group 2)
MKFTFNKPLLTNSFASFGATTLLQVLKTRLLMPSLLFLAAFSCLPQLMKAQAPVINYINGAGDVIGAIQFTLGGGSALTNPLPSPFLLGFNAGVTNPSGGALTYLWEFGDGTTSTAAKPTHTYAITTLNTAKTFTIKLTVKNAQGLSTSATTSFKMQTPPYAVGCLKVSFFNNITLSGTPSAPSPQFVIDHGTFAEVSERWEGTAIAPVAGSYTFTVKVNDGARLWVNNQLIIDKWFDVTGAAPATYNANINLTQGQNVPIKLEFYHKSGADGLIQLSWTIPTKTSTLLPFMMCYPTTPTDCSTFPTPDLTIVQQSEASTITINNLPAGASSSIGGAFIVGKSVYDSGLTPGLVTVKMKLGSCTSEKTVRILARGFPQFDPACYRIVNKATGKALEVQTNSMADGAQIVQGVPNGSTSQSWQKVNFNYQFFSFLSKSSDKALTASSCVSGTLVKQNAFIETDNQKWFIDELLDGSIKIKNRACGGDIGTLRARGSGTPNIDIAKDDGSDAFKWIVQAVACPNKCSFTPTITGASSVNIGGTIQLTGTPTSGTTQWTSSNYGIVGVSATGLVNALIDGTATINYFVTKDGCTANAVKIIKVNPVFDPEKCYTVMARHSGKVMEIAEHSTANGANIQQGAWGYSRRQVWRFKSLSGAYILTNGYSGKAVTVKGSSPDDGANIEQSQNTYANNQIWYLAKNAEGYYTLRNGFSGKMVDVSGASTANGANILQWAANGQNNQQWKIASVGCPAGTVSSQSAEIYTAEGYREGQKGIITWLSNAANADYFTVEKQNKNGDFEALSTVNAKPMIDFSDKNYYSYTDNTTEEGENIYRVALVADNTPPQYSGLIALNFKATIDFALYPNPTSDYVEVDLLSYQEKAVALTLSDASGKEVRFVKIEKAAKTHRIELNDLTTGQYIMRIQTAGKRDVTRVLNVTK